MTHRMIKLFDRNKRLVSTWLFRMPEPPAPFIYMPNVVFWQGGGFFDRGTKPRYFQLNPASTNADTDPEYFEIDEPVSLGDLA